MHDNQDKIGWWKSSHSSDGGCVEISRLEEQVLVRDSKDRNGPVLRFSYKEWKAFLDGVRDGEFEVH